MSDSKQVSLTPDGTSPSRRRPKPVATNDYRHLLHLAVGGRVVTELPPFLAHEPIARGQLVEVLPDHPLPQQSVRALVADTRLLSPLIRQFLDVLAEAMPRALERSGGP
jgi:DNA-binding transcriptional LysR family regulator